MREGAIRYAVMALSLFSSAHSADAHGIAGNRFFVGTLTFDDPSIADEAIVPNFSTLNHPVEGGSAVDNRFDWSFTRLLTPVLQMKSTVPGYTATGPRHGPQGSRQPMSASKAKSIVTISTKCSYQRGCCGGSGIPARRS